MQPMMRTTLPRLASISPTAMCFLVAELTQTRCPDLTARCSAVGRRVFYRLVELNEPEKSQSFSSIRRVVCAWPCSDAYVLEGPDAKAKKRNFFGQTKFRLGQTNWSAHCPLRLLSRAKTRELYQQTLYRKQIAITQGRLVWKESTTWRTRKN
jgi:hypothetical protein